MEIILSQQKNKSAVHHARLWRHVCKAMCAPGGRLTKHSRPLDVGPRSFALKDHLGVEGADRCVPLASLGDTKLGVASPDPKPRDPATDPSSLKRGGMKDAFAGEYPYG